MAWTNPKTWNVNDVLTAADMNTYVRDNLNALKAPPTDEHTGNEASNWSTTSTSFVDVDATDLALTITTTGGDVLVHFHGTFDMLASAHLYLDVDVDGTRNGLDDGIVSAQFDSNADEKPLTFTRLIQGLSAASHTFKLMWKLSGSTVTLFAGAGTASRDTHPQFWVREV